MRKIFYANWGKYLSSSLLLAGGVLLAGTAEAQVDAYTFAASTGTYTPLTNGTAVTDILGDDRYSGTLPLGFSFVFDGTAYSSFVVSSNGWLSFNTAVASSNLTNDLDEGDPDGRPLVAPFWDDLDGRGSSAAASYATTGTAPNRVFTFEWSNWYRYNNSSSPFSMQVQLFEGTNQVRFMYNLGASSPIAGASASIGLSGIATTSCASFLSLSDATAAPTASGTVETDNIADFPAVGQVYAFTPPVPSNCPTPRCLAATTTTNTSATVSWSVSNSTPGPFTVIYGLAGFNPATGGTTLTGITGTSTTISGLAANTAYEFYVTQNSLGRGRLHHRTQPAGQRQLHGRRARARHYRLHQHGGRHGVRCHAKRAAHQQLRQRRQHGQRRVVFLYGYLGFAYHHHFGAV